MEADAIYLIKGKTAFKIIYHVQITGEIAQHF
jgi:hypothetical protein